MSNAREQGAAPGTTGIVLHRAFLYDLFVWLVSLGKERVYRGKALDLANLKPSESVLDIGCGTGTLAIAAKQRVGCAGRVYGFDASPEMLARAGRKANKAGAEVVFKNGIAEALPFPGGNSMRYCLRSCFITGPQSAPAVCSRGAKGSKARRK